MSGVLKHLNCNAHAWEHFMKAVRTVQPGDRHAAYHELRQTNCSFAFISSRQELICKQRGAFSGLD
jgi:hypothetical protein